MYIAMKQRWKRSLKGAGAALILSLSGCAELANIKRGAEDANKPAFAAETSRQLRQRYDHLATGLIAQGLLRTDAGSNSPRATPKALTELFLASFREPPGTPKEGMAAPHSQRLCFTLTASAGFEGHLEHHLASFREPPGTPK